MNPEIINENIQSILRSADLWPAGPRTSRPQFGQAEFRSRGRLPHLLTEDGIYFVTWRLIDALPHHVIEKISIKQEIALMEANKASHKIRKVKRRRVHLKIAMLTEKLLDKGFGSCSLKDPSCAEIMANSLNFFDGKRYRMLAWVVMPNHVHAVFKPYEGEELSKIIKSWKSFSAKEINRAIGRTGQLWQREYFDRLIRDEDHLEKALLYVANNPVKAGLQDWKWVRIG